MVEPNPYTQRIVRFCTDLKYADLEAEVIAEAKKITLDLVGAMLVASAPRYSASRLTADLAGVLGGRQECTIVGREDKTSCLNAALANGTRGYAADIEGGSVNPKASQHASAVLVPAALAMAERQHAHGRAFITALVLGYDVCARVGEACRTEQSYPHSFHLSAVFGHFGAAAVAGHILGLDESQFTNALGLAGINAAGLVNWVTDLSENSRPYVLGVAAANGLRAALLAQMGFGGPPAILDPTRYNIYDAFSGEMHLDRLTLRLGEEFWIKNILGYKVYPSCLDIHTGLDAFLKIMSQARLTAQDIDAITHRVKSTRAPIIDNNALKSHNAQYMLAVAAVRGRIVPTDILEDQRADPQVRDMFQRVRLVGDPGLDSKEADRPAVVEVATRDGRRFVEAVDWPKGSTRNPLSREELEGKFMSLATTVLPVDRAEAIACLVNRLETVCDIGELAELLRFRA